MYLFQPEIFPQIGKKKGKVGVKDGKQSQLKTISIKIQPIVQKCRATINSTEHVVFL